MSTNPLNGSVSVEESRFKGSIVSTPQKRSGKLVSFALAVLAFIAPATAQSDRARWDAARANAWYAHQRWLVGANYLPSDAINQLEMFQDPTFNEALNDKELGMAEEIGMNSMRVCCRINSGSAIRKRPQGSSISF